MNLPRACLRWCKKNWSWLKWPIALAVLVYLFIHHRAGFADLASRDVQWGYLCVAFLLCSVSILTTFFRWYLLVWAQDFQFTVRDAMRLGFIGFLFNFLGPGAVGGDVVKAYMIARENRSRRAVAVATIILDRLLGLLALFMVGAFTILFTTPFVQQPAFHRVISIFWAGTIAGCLGLGVLMIPAVPRSRWLQKLVTVRFVGRAIRDLANAVLLYQSKWRVLAFAMVISIAGHFGILSAFYLVARALHPTDMIPGYWTHLQFIPAAELVGVVIPLPGGIGALEEAVAHYYGVAGAATDDGFLTAIAYRGLTVLLAALGSVFYFASRREIEEVLEESTHSEDEDMVHIDSVTNPDAADHPATA